jgi:hypothetical protein
VSVINGRAWLALQNGQLLALDATTGKPAARFSNVALSLADYSFGQHPVQIGNRLIAVLGLRVIGVVIDGN